MSTLAEKSNRNCCLEFEKILEPQVSCRVHHKKAGLPKRHCSPAAIYRKKRRTCSFPCLPAIWVFHKIDPSAVPVFLIL